MYSLAAEEHLHQFHLLSYIFPSQCLRARRTLAEISSVQYHSPSWNVRGPAIHRTVGRMVSRDYHEPGRGYKISRPSPFFSITPSSFECAHGEPTEGFMDLLWSNTIASQVMCHASCFPKPGLGDCSHAPWYPPKSGRTAGSST